MLLGLRTAIYPVTDLTKAKAWYAKVLGFDPYFDQPFYVGFSVGGFELGLLPSGTPGVHGPQPLWGVSNATEAMKRLLSLGQRNWNQSLRWAKASKSLPFKIPLAIAWASSRIQTSRSQRFGEAT